jgi:capsular exopolysaccharide synthesis family protein
MSTHGDELTLRDYAAVVARRRWIVITSAVLSSLVAILLVVLQTPIYSSSSEVLVQPRGADGLFEDQIVNLNDRAIETEIQVIEGQQVRERVRTDLGLDELPPLVAASAVGQTDVISLAVRDANATNTATLANAYADAYISVRREQAVDELLAASTEVQSAIDDLQLQLDGLADDDPLRTPLVAQAANFNTTLDQLRVDAALRTGGAAVIESAEVPTSPVEPTPVRTVTLAMIVGLLIGLGAAFLIDHLDDKVRTDDDLERISKLPVLAVVPVDSPPDHWPIAISEPSHTAVESFRGLRTNLQFLGLDQSISVVQLTSSMAGEGKTTTAANLAVVLAQAGKRVAIVDADLRRPRLHEVFAVPQTPGLTDLLLGSDPKSVVNRVQIDAELHIAVYPSGPVPSNPSELLSSRRVSDLLEQMGAFYDYVIVDSAPVLPVSDSVALSAAVDAVLVVTQSGRVTEHNVIDTLERLSQVSAPVLGMVLNQASGANQGYYSYGGYAPRTDVAQASPVGASTVMAAPRTPADASMAAPEYVSVFE